MLNSNTLGRSLHFWRYIGNLYSIWFNRNTTIFCFEKPFTIWKSDRGSWVSLIFQSHSDSSFLFLTLPIIYLILHCIFHLYYTGTEISFLFFSISYWNLIMTGGSERTWKRLEVIFNFTTTYNIWARGLFLLSTELHQKTSLTLHGKTEKAGETSEKNIFKYQVFWHLLWPYNGTNCQPFINLIKQKLQSPITMTSS